MRQVLFVQILILLQLFLGSFNEKSVVLFTLKKNNIFTLKKSNLVLIHFILYFVLIVKTQSFQAFFISFSLFLPTFRRT